MNKKEHFVITINRELGSGGRTVGEILAKKLGVTFYDKALVDSRSCLAKYGKQPDVLTTENVFQAETEILNEIAEEESCVIAGRCGFFVFRNHPNHLSVLIQAPMANRVARVAAKQHISEAEARQIIKKVDNMRENYVTRFTGTTRYDTRNYDLVFNADGKTEEQIADQILSYIE